MFQGHKRPADKAGIMVVAFAPGSKNAFDTRRTNELHLDIAAPCVSYPNFDGDVFQNVEVIFRQHFFGDNSGAFDPSWDYSFATHHLSVHHSSICEFNCRNAEPCLRLHQIPGTCHGNISIGVQFSIAVLVREGSSDRSSFPIGIFRIDLNRSIDAEMLDVSPCQVRARR